MMRSGAQAQRRADEIGHRDDPWSRAERSRFCGGTLQLARVLDQDDALVDTGHCGEKRIGERGFPRASAAGHQDVVPLGDAGFQSVRTGLRHDAVGDIVFEAVEALCGLSDREAGCGRDRRKHSFEPFPRASGRNSIGGAVSIVTRTPRKEFGFQAT